MHTYHYCATWQSTPNQIAYFDGIAHMQQPVADMPAYEAMKEQIRVVAKIPEGIAISLVALTPLYATPQGEGK